LKTSGLSQIFQTNTLQLIRAGAKLEIVVAYDVSVYRQDMLHYIESDFKLQFEHETFSAHVISIIPETAFSGGQYSSDLPSGFPTVTNDTEVYNAKSQVVGKLKLRHCSKRFLEYQLCFEKPTSVGRLFIIRANELGNTVTTRVSLANLAYTADANLQDLQDEFLRLHEICKTSTELNFLLKHVAQSLRNAKASTILAQDPERAAIQLKYTELLGCFAQQGLDFALLLETARDATIAQLVIEVDYQLTSADLTKMLSSVKRTFSKNTRL